MDNCNAAYLTAPGLYGRRAFFYTLPIGLVVGPSYLALKIVNAFLHIVTALLLFNIVKSRISAKAGVLSLILLLLQPEWWFTITAATPDNLAIPLLLASFSSVSRLGRQTGMGGAIFLALTVLVLEWCRSIGLLVLLAMLAMLVLDHDRSTRVRRLLLAAVVLIAFFGMLATLNWFFPGSTSSDSLNWLWAFDTTIRPPQNAQVLFEWLGHLSPAIEPTKHNTIGFARFVDELGNNYADWPAYMAAKSSLLFKGTGNLFFLGDHWPGNLDYVYTVQRNTVPDGPLVREAAQSMTIPLLIIFAFALARSPLGSFGLTALAFLGILLVILVPFGTILTRYGTLAVPTVAIVGAHLAGRDHLPDKAIVWNLSPFRTLMIGLALLASVFAFGAGITSELRRANPRLLQAITQDAPFTPNDIECNQKRVPIWPYYFYRLILSSLGPDVECASFSVPLPKGIKEISFFVTRERLPFPSEHLPPVAFEYAFRVGAEPIEWRRLSGAAAWHAMDVPQAADGAARLQVIVRRMGSEKEVRFQIRDLLARR